MSGEPFEPVVLASFPADGAKPIARVSGRLIATSLGEMRARGLERAYFDELSSALHPVLRAVVPSEWVDVDVAVAHYMCMSAVIPDPEMQREVGRGVSRRRRNSYLLRFLTTAIRTTGISPLTILRRSPAIWSRVFDGGGAAAVQTGSHRVHITISADPLVAISYFRAAVTGVTEAGVGFVASRVQATERLRSASAAGELDIDVTWEAD